MESDREPIEVTVKGGGGWIAIAIIIVCFWGEPSLIDALIHRLTATQNINVYFAPDPTTPEPDHAAD